MRRRALLRSGVDYSKRYFTFEAIDSGTFTLTIPSAVDTQRIESVSYSIDNGKTWTTTANNSGTVYVTTPTIPAGGTVLWKAEATKYAISNMVNYASKFSSTGKFNVSGNIMSLLYGDSFSDKTELPNNSSSAFCYLFYQNSRIVSAETLILPATTLKERCYSAMFIGCTSLTKAPELPATTLANYCYSAMFSGCTSLTKAPELPATTLANYCYEGMFSGCTSLTTAPELPATTLANFCYSAMFYDCKQLSYIKAMFTTSPSSSYTNNWVYGVAATGTFVQNPEAAWTTRGNNSIPYNWTVETASS